MRALLAIVWAVLVALLGWRAVAAKAPEIQEDIRSRTAAVIAPLLPTANVEVDGRFVTLRGEAPDEAALKNVVNAARRVDGALGPWNGLWVAIKAPAEDASAARVVELEAALAKARSEADSALARAGELDVLIAKLTADADAAKARIAELEKLAAGAGDADKLRADLDAAKAALAAAEALRGGGRRQRRARRRG
ncbi:MAG: BON domain-containing protein [Phyllobacteriaceae bacterium]|nr:BON domain-containing protein [Phyllobacteriaceae bacterium]